MKTATLSSLKTPDIFKRELKTIRAVVYGRVSSDEQAKKEFSIPEIQIPECLNLIKESRWRFIKTYIDKGLDCNTFLKRPELQKMLTEDIDTFDVLIVWSFDRLVGDDENTRGQIYHILDKNRKQITSIKQRVEIVPSDEYDPKNLNVSQQRQISNIGVSWDRKIRRERFMESRYKTVAGGRHIVEPPYGYKMIRKVIKREGERPLIRGYRAVNEEEAPILKEIFHERVFNGKGGKLIAILLNEKGIKTRKGSDWTGARIYQILRNPFPAGCIIWNRTHERKFGDETRRESIPEEKWQYFPVDRKREKYYKPLVGKELFDKAQEMTKTNRRSGKGAYSRNILAGLIKCPTCGKSMVETSFYPIKKPPFYKSFYVCSEYFNKGKCAGHKCRAWQVKELVLRRVERYLKDPQELRSYQEELRERKIQEKEKELKSYERKMRKCQERIYSLNMKYIDGKIKEDYYKPMLDTLEQEETALKESVLKLKDELREYTKRKETIFKMRDLGKEFHKKFRELDQQRKKLMLRALIQEITVETNSLTPKKVNILFKV